MHPGEDAPAQLGALGDGVHGAPLHELRAADLSPGCQQASSRRFDFAAYNAELTQAQSVFPRTQLRPLLLYFNNLDLPLTEPLAADFERLRLEADLRGQPPPFWWGTATAAALHSFSFDETWAWTFSTDPSLLDGLNQTIAAKLPLRVASATPPGGALLFSAEESTWVKEFKGCDGLEEVRGVDFDLGGEAVVLRQSAPPRVQVEVPPIPVEKTAVQARRILFSVEACRQDCDSLYSNRAGAWVWNEVYGCLEEP